MAERFVYLARHGETDWNVELRWQGHTDIALNSTGQTQARALAATMAMVPLVGIASSDLARASETARIVAERLGLRVAYTDVDLRERAFGVFEGLTRDQCISQHPEAWRAWVEEHRAPHGGEEPHAVAARMTRAIARAASHFDGDGAVLLVTHGSALRAAVHTVTPLAPLPPPVANGGVWRLGWAGRITLAEAFARGG